MTERALARIDTGAILLSSNFDEMLAKAKLLLGSGLLPESIKKPEQAIVVMLKGQELGIPPMEALNRINVIKGKPSLSASLMAALVERAYGPKALIVEESTTDHCTVSVWKPGWDKRRTVEFSMEDAKRAQIQSHMYQKYPRAMLRSRAISEACETHFQAIVGGLYTPEELGAEPAPDDLEVTEVETVVSDSVVTTVSGEQVDTDTGEIIEGAYTESVPFETAEELAAKGTPPEMKSGSGKTYPVADPEGFTIEEKWVARLLQLADAAQMIEMENGAIINHKGLWEYVKDSYGVETKGIATIHDLLRQISEQDAVDLAMRLKQVTASFEPAEV